MRQPKHLALALKTTPEELTGVLCNQASYVKKFRVRSNGKSRMVLSIRGLFRKFQKLLYRNVLLPNLLPSDQSHGGVVGRSILTNVTPHIPQRYLFSTDISSFYPNIHHTMIYKLFVGPLKCSPDVARICTKLTTYDHHLALGLITSPILANQVLSKTDSRINSLCKKNGLTYTRYVDDLSISAPFSLEKSGFARLVEKILNQAGFKLNRRKNRFGKLADGVPITKIRIVDGHPDVLEVYLERVWQDLLNAERLSHGRPCMDYLTRAQVWGKIQFICWINATRGHRFIAKFDAINWRKHEDEALRQGVLDGDTDDLIGVSVGDSHNLTDEEEDWLIF